MAKRRGFSSIEEHDEHIIAKWNSVVNKRDVTYILGDMTMEKSSPYPLLDRLNGFKTRCVRKPRSSSRCSPFTSVC
jgi:calcineurin-like phosphoesterase family protein